jgi:HPt (histidine-containing phosphotransfer) domain-containing protein
VEDMNDATHPEENQLTSEGLSVCPIDLEAAKERVMGDMAFLKEMLSEFIESVPAVLETLERAVQHGDVELLSKTAHQFKGTAMNLSLNQISKSAVSLLEMGRRNQLEQAGEALMALREDVMALKNYFHSSF